MCCRVMTKLTLAYSPLSALAKHQSHLSLHDGKLMFHTKFVSLIGFLYILLIITVTILLMLKKGFKTSQVDLLFFRSAI